MLGKLPKWGYYFLAYGVSVLVAVGFIVWTLVVWLVDLDPKIYWLTIPSAIGFAMLAYIQRLMCKLMEIE